MEPAPTPLQVLTLWNLLFTGDTPKLSDLKPRLSPAQRRPLVAGGLIELEKRGRAKHVVLTEKAWAWAADNLDAEFSPSVNAAIALKGLLPKLLGYIRATGTSLAEMLTAPAPEGPAEGHSAPPAASTGDRIRNAYRTVAHGQWNVRVRLADLRHELTDLTRGEVDEILLRLQRHGQIVLYPLDDPLEIRAEDRMAALEVGGRPAHVIYMEG